MQEPLPSAGEVMRRPACPVAVDAPLVVAARELAAAGRSGAPVVDATGRLVGLLTEADLLCGLTTALAGDAAPLTVGQAMTADARSVAPDADLLTLVQRLVVAGEELVPVVEAGELVGIVTRAEVLAALLRLRPGA